MLWCTEQYCTQCKCTQYAFYAHQRWSPRGHGLSVEDPWGQLAMSLVLGFKSLVFALDCQSLALDYQCLALGSKSLILPWLSVRLGLGLSVLDLGLSVLGLGLGSCPWYWPWAIKFSRNEPSTHFHSHKCQEVLRFHSWAVLFSWLCGFMEGSPAGSRFPRRPTPSPAGKYLLQHSHLGTSGGC